MYLPILTQTRHYPHPSSVDAPLRLKCGHLTENPTAGHGKSTQWKAGEWRPRWHGLIESSDLIIRPGAAPGARMLFISRRFIVHRRAATFGTATASASTETAGTRLLLSFDIPVIDHYFPCVGKMDNISISVCASYICSLLSNTYPLVSYIQTLLLKIQLIVV